MSTIAGIALETSTGAEQTAQTLKAMVNLAEELNEAISQFRIGMGLTGGNGEVRHLSSGDDARDDDRSDGMGGVLRFPRSGR